ncbi:MAG: cytochrome c [Rudaea sp.]|uniref:c-type cytochrome n=1 Tax=unclassified Rudaea TaxID=2627037 RepID=UPI0010F904E7|nr:MULTISPECIES: cytochrome c [unclassified Rudaea]MBN8885690.1 cytochrome c [Rudaea sp.]
MAKEILFRLSRRVAAVVAVIALCASGFASAADTDKVPPPEKLVSGGKFVGEDGAVLYHAVCQGCHMPDAKGAEGAGHYPALAADPKLASSLYIALTVLKGRKAMPEFGTFLSDAQVAAIVNYVRTHFGNQYSDALSAADIAKFR